MEEDIVDAPDDKTSASPQIKPRFRRRWLLPTLLIVALLSGAVAWFVHITSRRPFFGKIDPATGYRCTFTIGQGWQPDKVDDFTRVQFWDSFKFNPTQPAPFLAWLKKYFPHPTPPATSAPATFSFKPYNQVQVCSFRDPLPQQMEMELQDGYPTLKIPKDLDLPFSMNTLEQKHILISGHRATWSVYKIDYTGFLRRSSANTKQVSYTYDYLVKVTGRPLWYEIIGQADEEHRTQIVNEMQQIRDSFRIEKVSGK